VKILQVINKKTKLPATWANRVALTSLSVVIVQIMHHLHYAYLPAIAGTKLYCLVTCPESLRYCSQTGHKLIANHNSDTLHCATMSTRKLSRYMNPFLYTKCIKKYNKPQKQIIWNYELYPQLMSSRNFPSTRQRQWLTNQADVLQLLR